MSDFPRLFRASITLFSLGTLQGIIYAAEFVDTGHRMTGFLESSSVELFAAWILAAAYLLRRRNPTVSKDHRR